MKTKLAFAILIGALILLSSCVKEVSQPLEPSMVKKLRVLPYDPMNIIYVNLKNLKKSGLLKDTVYNPEILNRDFNLSFFDSLGIDFNKDVDDFIVATEWTGSNLIIITLKNPVLKKTISNEKHGFYYTTLADKLLVISNEKEKINEIESGKLEINFTKNPQFRRMINSLKYKDQFWFMTKDPSLIFGILKNGNLKDEKLENLIRSLNFINFSIWYEKNLSISTHWECVDERKAYLLSSVLNGIVSIIALTEPNDPIVNELVGADIYVENKGVETIIKIPKRKIDLIKSSIIMNKLKRISEYER